MGRAFERLWRDVTYGVRIAAKNRGFTLAAVITLAFGVAASSATFTIVDTVVFRPLPYADADRLVKIWGTVRSGLSDVSFADFTDIAEHNTVFTRVAADDGMGYAVAADGWKGSVNGAMVTPGWLATLGVRPAIGRDFLPEESQPGRSAVVMLTEGFWRRRFSADPAVIGRTLQVDDTVCTIVGVLPPNVLRYSADFLKPFVPAEYDVTRGHRDLDVFARLRPGVTAEMAKAEMEVIGRRLEQAHPATNSGRGLTLVTLDKYYALAEPAASRGLVLMLGAVALVLLVACVNVANLLVARAAARGRECVIRAALGASRVRLVCQLLVEHLLLFLAGGAVGVLLASWAVEWMVALAVTEGYVPERMTVSLDGRVVGFSLAVSLLTGLAFGLVPALRASRVDLNQGLRESSQTVSASRAGSRTRRLLIVSELTLSLVLLVGFGLFMRSLIGLQNADVGFEPRGLLVTASDGGRSFASAVRFWDRALASVRAQSGVAAAAVTSRPPLHGARTKNFIVQGHPAPADGAEPRAGDILISADYFKTVRIPVVKGRGFTEQDTHASPPVAIVSQALARRYFRDEDPIGRLVQLDERGQLTCCTAASPVDNVWREIVGVAGDIRQNSLDDEPAATLYRPYTQIVEHDMYLLLRGRSTADVPRLVQALPAELRAIDPAREWTDVRHVPDVINESGSIRSRRFVLILLGGFAGLALALAGVGVYGVMAYLVIERRREIAVRVALGATRGAVLRAVLREPVRLLAVSLALGLGASHLLGRFISAMLFGVGPTDAATYVVVSCVLGGVAVLASYLPARRAALGDPVVALRE